MLEWEAIPKKGKSAAQVQNQENHVARSYTERISSYRGS